MTIINKVSAKSVMPGVTAVPDVVDAPTIGTATDVGTSRAYNNGAATVAFTAAATGGAATSYTAISTPGSLTASGASSPLTVTGLSSGTAYTFKTYGANASGTWSAVQSSASNSITATTVPQAPTMGSPSVATGQAYTGNANVSVPFTANATGGKTVSSYTVTSSSGNTNTGASSPIVVTDVVGTARTYTVTATNANGTSTASSASAATTPSSVPQAPTIGTFTDGGTGTTGTLSFTANATGGSAITNYKVSTDNATYTALSPAQTSSPLSLSGLSVGTATYYIKAVNTNGDSAASSGVSGTVLTPSAFESIATATGTGSSGTITFSNIPQTYTSLQIRFGILNNGSRSRLYFNSDSTATNYAVHSMYGDGTTVYTNTGTGASGLTVLIPGSSAANIRSIGIINIDAYTSTTNNKTVRIFTGFENSGSGEARFISELYIGTSAITSLSIQAGSGSYTTDSTFALYGIKG